MPRGPKGEKRPADVIGAAVIVGRRKLPKRPLKPDGAKEFLTPVPFSFII